MHSKLFYIILTMLLSISIFSQEEGEKLIEVEVPMSIEKIIKLDFVPNTIVKVANESLVNFQVSQQKKEVMLVGQKAGETTMTLRDTAGDVKARYLIKVTSSDQTKVVGILKDLLKDVEGLEIGLKGDKVYVGGQIVVPSDIGKVVVVLEGYPDVLRLVELSPHTQLIIAKKMQDEMQKNGLKDVTVRVVNGQFWIEGVVGDLAEKEKADQIANAYLPDQIQNLARRADAVQSVKKKPFENLITINAKPAPKATPKLFKITAQFVELTKSYDKVFGFGWTPVMGDNGGQINIGRSSSGVTTSSSNTLAATISNLFPKLNSAKSAGYARVIQSGIIVTEEDVKGVLKKETDIPYTVGTTQDNTKVGTAHSGFTLVVTPKMLQDEKIDLAVEMTIKSTTGQPITQLNNDINTKVIVKSQESAVLGGVVTNQTTTNFDKDPPDSVKVNNGIPLFGFLKSKNYSTNRSQYVMFITPEIIESAATGVSEIERKFRKRSR